MSAKKEMNYNLGYSSKAKPGKGGGGKPTGQLKREGEGGSKLLFGVNCSMTGAGKQSLLRGVLPSKKKRKQKTREIGEEIVWRSGRV